MIPLLTGKKQSLRKQLEHDPLGTSEEFEIGLLFVHSFPPSRRQYQTKGDFFSPKFVGILIDFWKTLTGLVHQMKGRRGQAR